MLGDESLLCGCMKAARAHAINLDYYSKRGYIITYLPTYLERPQNTSVSCLIIITL